ncbi:MAG: calcium-binding protein, partial [Cyanobacteria bacterium P01_C01_bin.72]
MPTPTEWLDEFQVNTGAAADDFQFSPDIIGLSNGNFLVAWIEADNLAIPESIDIIAKIYDPQGNVVRNAFQLNTTTFDTGGRAGGFDIAPTNNGGFILVYEDNNTDLTTESAVRWERFDSIGNSTGHVAQIALENSSENFLQSPQLAVDLTDNTSVVTFTEIIGDNYNIRGRHLSATGTLLDNEFDAAQNSNDFDGTGDVAILSTGDYVSVYQERDGGIPGI